MIPKIIHQIWIGDKPIPAEEQRWMETWKHNNPNFEHMLWTNDNIPELPKKYEPIITSLGNKMALVCDIYRYFILYTYGGFYIDTDIINYRNIDHLIDCDYVFLRPHINANHFTNAFFGIAKNQNLLIDCLDGIKPLNINQLKNGYAYTSGMALTKAITKQFNITNSRDDKIRDLNNIILLQPEYWYRNDKNQNSYMYHYARASHIEKSKK